MAVAMTEQEADEFLRTTAPTPTNTQLETSLQTTLTPRTNASLSGAEKALTAVAMPAASVATSVATRQQALGGDTRALTSLGARPGVPFDLETGAGVMSRLAQGMAFNRQEQEMLFRRMPNVQDVRFNTMGEPVLTIRDGQTGETRDVLANPAGLDPSDFAFVAANLPEMIAGTMAARGLNVSRSVMQKLPEIARAFLGSQKVVPSAARMALAGQGVGALQDIGSRAASSTLEADAATALGRRAANAGLDFLFGLGAGAAGAVAGRAVTPFNRNAPLQMDADAAVKLWRDKGGVNIDLTPGELTGSPFLLRSEAFMAQKPGSSTAFDTLMSERERALGKVQSILLGKDPELVAPVDVVGREALGTVQAQLAPLDFAVNRETQALLKTATTEIKTSLAAATKVPTPLEKPAVGAALFERAFAKLDEFRGARDTLYSKVTSHPAIAGQGRNIDATTLAGDARAILDKVAAVEKATLEPTGIVDEAGRPIMRDVLTRQPLTAFTDSGVRQRLEQLAGAEGGRMAYSDLIRLRRDIDDDLFRGSMLKGIPEKDLQELRDAVTRRIETGLKGLDPSGKLATDWQAANDFTARQMREFKDLEIVDIFKGREQAGALTLNRIVSRASNDPDVWDAYKTFYGASSDQMNMLRRVKADEVLGRIDGSEAVDAKGFLRRMEALYDKQPAIAQDVFGNAYSKLKGMALAAEQAGRKEVNVDELVNHIDRGTLTASKLEDLIAAQQKRDDTYRNDLLKRIGKGIGGPDVIKPSEFVDKVVFKGEPADIERVVTFLADQPEVLEQVRQRALITIFEDAREKVGGREMITATGLDRYLKDDLMARRLERTFGGDTMELLKATRDALAPGAVKQEVFGTAGRLSAGGQIATIERHLGNPATMWSEVSHIVKSFVLASLYKTGPVRRYVSNTAIENRDAWLNGFVVAEPVVEAAIDLWGKEASREAMIQAKQAMDAGMKSDVERQAGPTPGMSAEEAAAFLETSR